MITATSFKAKYVTVSQVFLQLVVVLPLLLLLLFYYLLMLLLLLLFHRCKDGNFFITIYDGKS